MANEPGKEVNDLADKSGEEVKILAGESGEVINILADAGEDESGKEVPYKWTKNDLVAKIQSKMDDYHYVTLPNRDPELRYSMYLNLLNIKYKIIC